MPPVPKFIDYARRSQSQSNIFDTLRVRKELSVSPGRFRFKRYEHTKLGIIHPEQFSAQNARLRKSGKLAEALQKAPEYKTFRPGDREFMEVVGYACPQINVEPNIKYTPNDKAQLPNHLKLFPRGRTPEETAIEHPSYFQYFQTYNPATNKEFHNILRGMSKQEREEFYHKSTQMNKTYFTIFKRFIQGLVEKGWLPQNYNTLAKHPKIPRKDIERLAESQGFVQSLRSAGQPNYQIINKKGRLPTMKKIHDQLPIGMINLEQLLRELGYPFTYIQQDANLLFEYSNEGSDKISLRAFLHNVQKYAKEKYKIKNIFSKNAAKQRNVYIKYSLYPFLGVIYQYFLTNHNIRKVGGQ